MRGCDLLSRVLSNTIVTLPELSNPCPLAQGINLVEICVPSAPLLANSAIMSTLILLCRWEEETARERTGL